MKTKTKQLIQLLQAAKSRKVQLVLMAITLFVMLGIASCIKKKEEEVTPASDTELDSQTRQFNDDANKYKNEADDISDDINTYIKDIPTFGRVATGQSSSPFCGVTVDSSQLAMKILIFNFDGITPCSSPSRTRAGQIKVQLTSGTNWSNPGAVLTETFINYKVTRLSDNKSITFNGVKKLTNINGNDWLAFLAGTAILKYKERTFNMQVTFDNAQGAVWNAAYMTEYNYTNIAGIQKVNFSCSGDTALNGFSNVSNWGTNRYGQSFTTNYNSPWKSNSYCGYWRPVSGELVHHVNNSIFMLTLGLDQSGNPSTLNCAYGYKVTWSNGTSTYSVILSY